MRRLAPVLLLVALGPVDVRPSADPVPVVVDTDAGSDDYLAIAYLLTQPDLTLDGITVVNGVAHVAAGARNLLRLCELAGREKVPVFAGESAPMEETAPFPDEWRIFADELPRTELPEARRPVESRPAVDFLAEVLRGPARRRLVALGPLTNLARALERVPAAERRGLESLVVMGGAVSVEGNLGDGGYFRTNNTTAEWNMFVDPRAAELVFASGLPIVLIPLDATRRVPIRASFVRDFSRRATTPLGRFAAVLLDNAEELVQKALYYAWDPLVAVSLVHPEVVKLRPGAIQILRGAPTVGRTWLVSGKQPNAQIAFDADARLFGRVFTAAFVPGR